MRMFKTPAMQTVNFSWVKKLPRQGVGDFVQGEPLRFD